MKVELSLASKELASEDLQNLTRDLSTTLNQETDVDATLPEQTGEAGIKGDPVTLGLIALTFLSSGAAVAFFNTVKAFFERDRSLEMDFQREDGKKLSIRAENVRAAQIDRTIKAAEQFFGGSQ